MSCIAWRWGGGGGGGTVLMDSEIDELMINNVCCVQSSRSLVSSINGFPISSITSTIP